MSTPTVESITDEIARLKAENESMKRRQLARGMSPAEAVAFDHNRPGYVVQPNILLGQRLECGCSFYDAVLSLRRWNALGFRVNKGEHAAYRSGAREQFALFCACQVWSPFGVMARGHEVGLDELAAQADEPIPGFEVGPS